MNLFHLVEEINVIHAFQTEDDVEVTTMGGSTIKCKRVIIATPPNMTGEFMCTHVRVSNLI